MNESSSTSVSHKRPFLRRVLFVIACAITLVALLYTVENVRGKRAWENCRRELEAKSASLDWAAYIPPPVPDEQNIFKAPQMAEWFVRDSQKFFRKGQASGSSSTNLIIPLPPYGRTNSVLIADLRIAVAGLEDNSVKSDTVWQFDSPEADRDAHKLLRDVIGQTAPGQQGSFMFVKRPFDEVKAVHISAQSARPPTVHSIRELFPSNETLPATSRLRVESSSSNSFLVWFQPPVWIGASNYLARTDQSRSNLELIRDALKRPYGRMDGDYQHPFAAPIPNFIAVRTVAQVLAQRTECYLLMGQPEDALRELTLLHDLNRLLKAEPTGKPMPLVSAMINVAITGLYAQTIAEGLRLEGWQEPQLTMIQQQLKETNLLPPFVRAFETESAGLCRTLESFGPGELFSLFSSGTINYSLWDKIKHPGYLLSKSIPRGWIYQNMATIAYMDQKVIESIDATKNCVLPSRADAYAREVQTSFEHFSPYRVLASIALPNFVKASQTLARNQTLVNQAFIACALERDHRANGKYPDTLDALVPQYADVLPRDVINGKPFNYRLTPEGYLLYSIGWNEKDDDGTPSKALNDNDWVWGQK